MGEPMAPPSGYSIPICNGTGLGPKYITGHTGMTVNGDDDETTNNGTQSLPPPQAPCVGSDLHLPKAPNNSNNSVGIPPEVPIAPRSAPNSNTTSTNRLNDDDRDNDDDNYDDINDNNHKNDGSYNDQPSSNSGRDSASYNDLAARFEALKNL